jgi:hypothetical protein
MVAAGPRGQPLDGTALRVFEETLSRGNNPHGCISLAGHVMEGSVCGMTPKTLPAARTLPRRTSSDSADHNGRDGRNDR